MRVIGGNGCFSLNAVTNLPCILPQERIHLLISYRKNRTQIRGLIRHSRCEGEITTRMPLPQGRRRCS